MKLPDANLLIYAVDSASPDHSAARRWLEAELSGTETFLAQPGVTIVEPTERHPAVLRELLEPIGAAGNLTTDAHLAAVAIEYGAVLYSADRDYARFGGLKWANPLT